MADEQDAGPAKWTPGKVFQIPVDVPEGHDVRVWVSGGDGDPGAAHEPDPLEARVIALEARVAAIEAVVGMALARPRVASATGSFHHLEPVTPSNGSTDR